MKLTLLLATLALALPLRADGSASFAVFADPTLDSLIAQALANNADLAAAAARVDQVRALAGAARADFFPQV
ncbi:MAG: TolC family protein, partial [Burkholderiales bacterium]|nr:TolC family protein [Opitutaceae bacterium]